MDITKEHVKFDKKGDILGVYVIKSEEAVGVDVWQKIDRVIREYTALHPLEMEATVRQNIFDASTRLNNIGSSKSKNLRWSLSLPVALMFLLERVEPSLFSNKIYLHKFMKKYKGLRVCKQV